MLCKETFLTMYMREKQNVMVQSHLKYNNFTVLCSLGLALGTDWKPDKLLESGSWVWKPNKVTNKT